MTSAGRAAAAMLLSLVGVVAATGLAAWLAVVSADDGGGRPAAAQTAGQGTGLAAATGKSVVTGTSISLSATSAASPTAAASPPAPAATTAAPTPAATATRAATPAAAPTAAPTATFALTVTLAPTATAAPSPAGSSQYHGNISFDSSAYAVGDKLFHCHSLLPEGPAYTVRISQTKPGSSVLSDGSEPGDGNAHCSSLTLKAGDVPQIELRAEFFIGGALVATASQSAAVR